LTNGIICIKIEFIVIHDCVDNRVEEYTFGILPGKFCVQKISGVAIAD
jgi:hypothetical protein